jgi:hypothetical protein
VPDYLLRGWNLPSLTASIAAIINVVEMDGADSRSAYAGNVKKSTVALIAHRLSELAPHLCQIIFWWGEICPLWPAVINVVDMNGADLQSANAGDVKKINNRVDPTQTQWACSPSMPDYLLRGWKLPSWTTSISAISDVDYMNGADLRSANARDVKKINNCFDSIQTQWAYSLSVPDYLL